MQLTDIEIAEVNDWYENVLEESKKFIERLKHKTDNLRTVDELKDFRKFEKEVEQGKVPMMVRVTEGYEEVVATVEAIEAIVILNRPFTVEQIKLILMKKMCPSTLTLHSANTGVEDAD